MPAEPLRRQRNKMLMLSRNGDGDDDGRRRQARSYVIPDDEVRNSFLGTMMDFFLRAHRAARSKSRASSFAEEIEEVLTSGENRGDSPRFAARLMPRVNVTRNR